MDKDKIFKRMAEIQNALAGTEAVDLDALETELRSLNEQLASIDSEAGKQQRRDAMLNSIPSGSPAIKTHTPIETRKELELDVDGEPKIYRHAWAKALQGKQFTDDEIEAFNIVNERALGTAVFTTDKTFVPATAGVDGVNNGGVLVPRSIMLDWLSPVLLDSPILRDIRKVSIPGELEMPYEKNSTGAEWYAELECGRDQVTEFATLVLYAKELAKTVQITHKLKRMAVEGFIAFINEEMQMKMRMALAAGVIYGVGGQGDKDIYGIKNSNLKITTLTNASIVETLMKATETVPKQHRFGMKIYISQEASNKIALTKDGSGAYLIPPVNGGGIQTVATVPVEIDPYLNPGDAVVGNLRNYILNEVETPITMVNPVPRCRKEDITISAIYASGLKPSTVVWVSVTLP